MLAAAVGLVWPGGNDLSLPVILPALSPCIALGSVISAKTVSMVTLLAWPVLFLAMFSPRWFCRYGCPMGLVQEVLERVGTKKTARGSRCPMIGPWLVWGAFGGAALGYPIFLWLDPLAMFNGFLNVWREPFRIAALLAGIGMPLVLMLGLVAPRVWCQSICPLGAMQDLLVWPRRWFRFRTHGATPDRVITETESSPRRRWFLAACAGAASAWTVKVVQANPALVLRPPGALDELHFTGICVRCGNCARACPSKIIEPDFGVSGLAGFLTPRLRFDQDYCREDCHRCNRVCPSGAIARLGLSDKRRHVIGWAKIDASLCLLARGRECTACIRKCPFQAIVMHSADGGFSNEPRILFERCNGCGACEAVCPTRPARAIQVVARSQAIAATARAIPQKQGEKAVGGRYTAELRGGPQFWRERRPDNLELAGG